MEEREGASRPTDGELAILRVMWARGPSTVREVHEALAGRRETGYTTTLKLMQIMAEKGILLRDSSQRTHVYFPRESAEVVERGLVRDLIDRAFDGAAGRLVLRALGSKKVTKEEAARIRELLDEIEGGKS
ncbi:BlaI/MecI/CopY family transcriptional regulator [Paludisphaera rhizosphaerae]|uniref:BlaI/MecI/CopY family transcriptional regulator n=1 Tax=Paludisphaera rhizosphaerae TaxID=2711216 RepID=UPI0013EB520E|nr:BlaI/MecI/CopY family transcriptional regulator [Paludisphaera rhizosphaerae]